MALYFTLLVLETSKTVYLVYNKTTTFTIFQLIPGPSESNSTKFTLEYDCSAIEQTRIVFKTNSSMFCDKKSLTGTIEELNLKFAAFSVYSLLDSPTSCQMHFEIKNTNSTSIFNSTLNFRSIFRIPLTGINNRIWFIPEKLLIVQNLTVAVIDSEFCEFFGLKTITIKVENGSKFSGYFFANCILVKTIGLDEIESYPKQFNITIEDNISGLKSEPINLMIYGMNISASFNESEVLVVLVFLTVLGLIYAGMFCYVKNESQRRNRNGYRKSQQNENYLKNDKVSQTENSKIVLSESILNWNQRLLVKYKSRPMNTRENFEKNINNILKMPKEKTELMMKQNVIQENKSFEDLSEIDMSSMHQSMNHKNKH